jgi:hypothetical protein
VTVLVPCGIAVGVALADLAWRRRFATFGIPAHRAAMSDHLGKASRSGRGPVRYREEFLRRAEYPIGRGRRRHRPMPRLPRRFQAVFLASHQIAVGSEPVGQIASDSPP